jgi:4-diphosphocytidyl-2-C-methyl-D-erythritol kinase
VIRASASAKINLALVVGPLRPDGKHEVATVLQRIDVADRLELRPSKALRVDGFRDDTLVRRALEAIADAGGVAPTWHARIEKRIPVAAGLGGGSSDAAAALRLANSSLPTPLDEGELHGLASQLGADVPFFLTDGPQLATADGTNLEPLELPQDFWIVLLLPDRERKRSTADVYARFDERTGAAGFEARREALLAALAAVKRSTDLAALPPNDLASSAHAEALRTLGAFRADVSGAGPAVYGLFTRERDALAAAKAVRAAGRTLVTAPAWYG